MKIARYQQRLQSVLKLLKAQSRLTDGAPRALLISSASASPASRDQFHPFRQSSDLLYLTGASSPDIALLVSTALPKPILFGTSPSKQKIIWEGVAENLSKLASSLKVEFIDHSAIESEVTKRLSGVSELFYSSEPNSLSLKVARKLFELPSHQRARYPTHFSHSDKILESLRLLKDIDEIAAIESANKVTNMALLCSLPFISPGKTEEQVAATIDYSFSLQSAEPGFASIVAAGKNAATLHHRPSKSVLKKNEMVLLDVGARLNNYCADISRVLPLGSKFTPKQAELYEVVLSAQKAALGKIRSGIKAAVVYDAAVRELCIGLKMLGILRAPLSQILRKKLFFPFFPHGIGHALGLDVHDIGNLRSDGGVFLQKGMVITVEPGLYFQKAIKSLPACGIRIEDNIVVTEKGCKILSAGFPKELKEIEALR